MLKASAKKAEEERRKAAAKERQELERMMAEQLNQVWGVGLKAQGPRPNRLCRVLLDRQAGLASKAWTAGHGCPWRRCWWARTSMQ